MVSLLLICDLSMTNIPVSEAFERPEEFEAMTVHLEPRQIAVIEGIADRLNVSTDHFIRYLINRVLIHPADGGFDEEEDIAAPGDAAGTKNAVKDEALDDEHDGALGDGRSATSAPPGGPRRRPSEKTLQLLRRVVAKMDDAEPNRTPHDQAHADPGAEGQPSMFDLANRSGPGRGSGDGGGT
jgi:hypothetical protein